MKANAKSRLLVTQLDVHRRRQKLSFEDIAKQTGFSKREVIDFFSLETEISLETFLLIADCLDVATILHPGRYVVG